MKICIPTEGSLGLNDVVGEHFGRVPTYTIVDSETLNAKIIPNTSQHMGGIGYPPDLMKQEGVNILICKGLGRKALHLFNAYDIEVYIGASGTVRESIESFKNGLLKRATEQDSCSQHSFRNQDHHEKHQHNC